MFEIIFRPDANCFLVAWVVSKSALVDLDDRPKPILPKQNGISTYEGCLKSNGTM